MKHFVFTGTSWNGSVRSSRYMSACIEHGGRTANYVLIVGKVKKTVVRRRLRSVRKTSNAAMFLVAPVVRYLQVLLLFLSRGGVNIDGALCVMFPVLSDVSRGSVPGPLLSNVSHF
jgi:hypothetical protein